MICAQIYSRGDMVPYDVKSITNMMPGTPYKSVQRIIQQLINKKKVRIKESMDARSDADEGPMLYVSRCLRELDRSSSRMATLQHNGNKGDALLKKTKA